MSQPEEIALCNDLRVTFDQAGGFSHLKLRDADDGDIFHLGEDELLALHAFLNKLVAEGKLPT